VQESNTQLAHAMRYCGTEAGGPDEDFNEMIVGSTGEEKPSKLASRNVGWAISRRLALQSSHSQSLFRV
jgi:hypothetical protein